MSEKLGRHAQVPQPEAPTTTTPGATPASPSVLSEADKERIRAEEEFRAQARAEAEAKRGGKKNAPPKKSPEELKAEQEEKKRLNAAKVAKEQARRAALTPAERTKENILVGLTLLLVLGFGAWVLRGCASIFSGAGDSDSAPLSAMRDTEVVAACQMSAEDKLRSPSTAKFQYATATFDGTKWNYVTTVDAQNAFGAMIRNHVVCTVTGTTRGDAMVSSSVF